MAEVREFGEGKYAFTYTVVASNPLDTAVAIELGIDCVQQSQPNAPQVIVPPCTDKQALDSLCALINERTEQVSRANLTAPGSEIPPLPETTRVEAMGLVHQIRPQLRPS